MSSWEQRYTVEGAGRFREGSTDVRHRAPDFFFSVPSIDHEPQSGAEQEVMFILSSSEPQGRPHWRFDWNMSGPTRAISNLTFSVPSPPHNGPLTFPFPLRGTLPWQTLAVGEQTSRRTLGEQTSGGTEAGIIDVTLIRKAAHTWRFEFATADGGTRPPWPAWVKEGVFEITADRALPPWKRLEIDMGILTAEPERLYEASFTLTAD